MSRFPKTLEGLASAYGRVANELNTRQLRELLQKQTWIRTTVKLDGDYKKAFDALADKVEDILATGSNRVNLGSKGQFPLDLEGPDPRAENAVFTKSNIESVFGSMDPDTKPDSNASFNTLNRFFRKLFPDLRNNYDLAHTNISVLRAQIALHRALTKDMPAVSAAANYMQAVITRIDDLSKEIGAKGVSLKDVYAATTAGINQNRELEVKLIKDFNEAAGKLNMTIEAQYQPATYNRSLGGLATNVIKDFKNFRKLQENSFTEAFERVTDISVLRGSPEPPEKIESMVAKRIAKGSATIDGRNPKPLTKTKSTRKSKPRILKGLNTKAGAKIKNRGRITRKPENKFPDPGPMRQPRNPKVAGISLQVLLQQRVFAMLQKNMIPPRLVYRTGTLAASVNITHVGPPVGRNKRPIINYTYQKFPYATFAKGGQGYNIDPRRDVDKLIQMSIRDAARGLVEGKFADYARIIPDGTRG